MAGQKKTVLQADAHKRVKIIDIFAAGASASVDNDNDDDDDRGAGGGEGGQSWQSDEAINVHSVMKDDH